MHHRISPHPVAISVALAFSAALIPAIAQADPPHSPAMKCVGGGLRSHPTFSQSPAGRAEYHFSGVCESRAGRFYGFFIDGTWTPNEPGPDNANASEVYHIVATSGADQKFDGVMGARCPNDPWLNEVACTRVGDNVPDELRALWPDLVERNLFPSTRHAIPEDQRAALLAEYERANGQLRPPRQ